jgi:hypothetical protein
MPRLFPHRFPSYNVAIIYEIQGKYEGLLEMHTKSLDIKTRILGGDSHLLVAASCCDIAIVHGRERERKRERERESFIRNYP